LQSTGKFLDIDSTPLFDQAGRLYIASYRTGIYCLDAKTGETLWHTEASGVASLVMAGRMLIASGDERIAAYSATHGEKIWTRDVGHRAAFEPAVAGSFVLAPTAKALLIMDLATGKLLQSFDPGKGVTATPAVHGPHVYVLSNEGILYAFRMNTRAS
jgi:outer membrane protein assembly factor BamB